MTDIKKSPSGATVSVSSGGGAVASVFGRAGVVVAAAGDYNTDQVNNGSGVPGATASDALDALGAAVSAVSAAVTGLSSDDVANASSVAGATVSDALESLDGPIAAGYSGPANVLVLGDAGHYVPVSNGAANTLEVPPNASVAFPVGTWLVVVQTGVGQTTILEGVGVTVHPPSSRTLAISERYGQVFLKKIAADEWWAIGTLGV